MLIYAYILIILTSLILISCI